VFTFCGHLSNSFSNFIRVFWGNFFYITENAWSQGEIVYLPLVYVTDKKLVPAAHIEYSILETICFCPSDKWDLDPWKSWLINVIKLCLMFNPRPKTSSPCRAAGLASTRERSCSRQHWKKFVHIKLYQDLQKCIAIYIFYILGVFIHSVEIKLFMVEQLHFSYVKSLSNNKELQYKLTFDFHQNEAFVPRS
jgi:hypothetical protein